jgi:hypothetical protein
MDPRGLIVDESDSEDDNNCKFLSFTHIHLFTNGCRTPSVPAAVAEINARLDLLFVRCIPSGLGLIL